MTDKNENGMPAEKRFVFNVNYKEVVNTEIAIDAETQAHATLQIMELYPEATIIFLREFIK